MMAASALRPLAPPGQVGSVDDVVVGSGPIRGGSHDAAGFDVCLAGPLPPLVGEQRRVPIKGLQWGFVFVTRMAGQPG